MAAGGVLRVFVAAAADIPAHRRVPIFSKLVATLGPDRATWLLLLVFVEAHVLKGV